VAGGDLAGGHVEAGGQAGPRQRHRTEVAAARLHLEGVEVEAGAAEQVDGDVALDPALDRHALGGRVLAHDVELRAGPAVVDGGPAIGGRGGLVHDDDAGGSAAGRLLVLVGPAPVIGHGPAVEGVQLGLFEVGVIDEDDDDLAAHVDVLEVIPVALRRGDAVAGEDQGRVGQGHAAAGQTSRDDDLLALGQGDGLAADLEGGLDVGGGEAVQGHVLGPAAVLAARLEAGRGVLLAEIAHDHVLGGGGDATPLEAVVGQHPRVLHQAGRVEGGVGRGRRGAGAGAGGEQEAGGERGGGRQETHGRNTLSRKNNLSGR